MWGISDFHNWSTTIASDVTHLSKILTSELNRKTRKETNKLSKIPYKVLKIYPSCSRLCRSTCINRMVEFDTSHIPAVSSRHHKLEIKIAVKWNWTMVFHVKHLLTKLCFCRKPSSMSLLGLPWILLLSIGTLNYIFTCGDRKV